MRVPKPLAFATLLVAAVAVWFAVDARRDEPPATTVASGEGTVDESAPSTELVSVQRRDVSESRPVNAVVGFGEPTVLPLEAEGLITWAPTYGSTLGPGDTAVAVASRPLVLALGEVPLYRPIGLRPSFDENGLWVPQIKGDDIAQLQRFLIGAGFDDNGRLTDDGQVDLETDRAIRAWQKSVGHPVNGVIDRSQLLFVTEPVRVESRLAVGQPFMELAVTSTATVLTAIDSTLAQPFFPVGSTVTVDRGEFADDAEPWEGIVSSSNRVSDPDSGQIAIEIQITVRGVAAEDLGENVRVVGTQTTAKDALTIPVRALLALTEGGWAVQISQGTDTELVGVELVAVADTTAVITGLNEGDDVVVPL